MMNFMLGLVVLVGGQMGANQDFERKVLAYEALIARMRCSNVSQGGLENNDRILGHFSGQVDAVITARLPGGDLALMTTDMAKNGSPRKLYLLKKPDGPNLPEKTRLPGDALLYKTGETSKIRNIECEVLELVFGASWENVCVTASRNMPKPADSLGDTSGGFNGGSVQLMLINAANEIHQRKNENLLRFERARLEAKRKEADEIAANKAETAKKMKAEAEVANRIPGAKAALDKLVSDMGKSVTNYKRINSKMDDDWYIQIDFTKKAIARHIEKLEQAKAGWSKMGMDQQTITEMTKKANDAIALGKATLAKGSAK